MNSWLLSNGLMLSKDKTKLTIISSMFRPCPELNSIFVSDELIHASSHTSNLSVLFDERFSFNKHISSTCKVAYYHLRNIAHKRRHLDDFCLKTVVYALVCPVYTIVTLFSMVYHPAKLQHAPTCSKRSCGSAAHLQNTKIRSHHASSVFSSPVAHRSQNKF